MPNFKKVVSAAALVVGLVVASAGSVLLTAPQAQAQDNTSGREITNGNLIAGFKDQLDAVGLPCTAVGKVVYLPQDEVYVIGCDTPNGVFITDHFYIIGGGYPPRVFHRGEQIQSLSRDSIIEKACAQMRNPRVTSDMKARLSEAVTRAGGSCP